MNIIFFAHPNFLGHQSMPRFARMLANGMRERGHEVAIWSPEENFRKMVKTSFFKKWFGYIDQYILFPQEIKSKIKEQPISTLYVFTDHALGPWVQLVKEKPNVIHCHDFLAQYSAIGKIEENKTGWFGIQYQKYIRNGFRNGKNFISVSKKTKDDLHDFLQISPEISEVVYNGLNRRFEPGDTKLARIKLEKFSGKELQGGYILHVGGNQWYKNRIGIIKIYNAWRKNYKQQLPLVLIGSAPDVPLMNEYYSSPFKESIYFLEKVPDTLVIDAYVGAKVFLFPSLAEGFGWPIAEAMACGCPVITTNEAPMTEVAKDTGKLIERMPSILENVDSWAAKAAVVLNEILSMSERAKIDFVEKQLLNARRFQKDLAINSIEKIYKTVIKNFVAS